MRYEFHPEALDEYNEAGHYYAQRQPGLDLRFIASVEETIERILEDPYRRHPLTKMSGVASPEYFLSRSFTRLRPATSSLSRSLIAAVSPDTGSIDFPNKAAAPNRRPRFGSHAPR